MSFRIVRNDITQMKTDAIVNPAMEQAGVGSGCDYAIYTAAGYDELLSYRKEKIGAAPEGEAFITPGFRLRARYIIHAVSPLYKDGHQGEEEKLRSCYRRSLQLAKANHLRSIAFPLLATGSFGYPKEEGLRIAVDEIHAFLLREDMDIFLVVFDRKATQLGEKIYPDLEAYIDYNYVKEARFKEYGDPYFGSVLRNDPRCMGPAPKKDPRCMDPAPKKDSRFREPLPSTRKFSARAECNMPALGSELPSRKFPSGELPSRKFPSGELPSRDLPDRAPSLDEACPACDEVVFADFDEQHEGKLQERMKHLSDTYSEYLMYLIQDKKMENAEVWKRAIVDKKIFSKIKNNVNYHPNKMTALCLCVGAKLNIDETRDLLARAGYALSPCDKTDIIFSYFIENEIYDMIELDIQLEEHGLPCIIT